MRYDPDEVPQLSSSLAESIKARVKGVSSKLDQSAVSEQTVSLVMSAPQQLWGSTDTSLLSTWSSESREDKESSETSSEDSPSTGQKQAHSPSDTLLCLSPPRMSLRCLWDADTDNYAEDVFMNVGPPSRRLHAHVEDTAPFFSCTSFVFHRTVCSVP